MMSDNPRLDDYLSAWNLADPRLLTQTHTSQLYTVTRGDETVVLKLLAPNEVEEQRGAAALRHFDGQGAVRLLGWDDGAQLLEYADGPELVTLVERGDDQQATEIIAQLLGRLHSVSQPIPPQGLVRLEDWFGALFTQAQADRRAGVYSIYRRGAGQAQYLLASARELRVLHADIHHRNIRQSARGWLCFDPKGLVGERTYDCANTLCNPVMPELVHNEARLLKNAALLAGELELDLARVLGFTYAYACLNASQWLRHLDAPIAEQIIAWHLKVAEIIEPHLRPV